MPITIEWEPQGAYKQYVGHVTGEELLESMKEVHRDFRFDTLRYVINDFSGMEGFSVTEMQVQIAAAHDYGAAHTNPNIRIAIVTTDEKIKALAQVYAAPPLEPYPTEIFSTVSGARDWIHCQPPLDRRKPGIKIAVS